MRFSTFFFDLDETLYPASAGLWMLIRERINLFLRERMGFPPEQVESLREQYFREYGTTLRGLQANYNVDMDDYLAFVHDVPLAPYLLPNPELRGVIASIQARKFIFTNADCAHASRVTKVLGLDGLWNGCIDVHAIAPYTKPMPEAFDMALKAAGSPDPRTCVMLDDQARITRAARSLGMYTILVGKESAGEDADAALDSWADLHGLLDGKI
jgi:putative hydrolase of the HAD superfamily